MREVLRAVHTENKPDKVRTHHQQYVKDTSSGAHVTIPPPFSKLHT
jgi:hypothetical protein